MTVHLSSYIGPSEGVLAAALSHSEWLRLPSPGYYCAVQCMQCAVSPLRGITADCH